MRVRARTSRTYLKKHAGVLTERQSARWFWMDGKKGGPQVEYAVNLKLQEWESRMICPPRKASCSRDLRTLTQAIERIGEQGVTLWGRD